MGKKSSRKKKKGSGLVNNRKARHDFHVLETIEAGIELRGTEVKSCRIGNVSMRDSFAKIENGQIFLYNVHISPYSHGNLFNHDPLRPRRLLLHKKEILKLRTKSKEKGLTLVPLKFYLKKGRIKVLLAVAKGKTKHDKRETLKRKQHDFEAKKIVASKTKS